MMGSCSSRISSYVWRAIVQAFVNVACIPAGEIALFFVVVVSLKGAADSMIDVRPDYLYIN